MQVVVDLDVHAGRHEGVQTALGPQSSLAHYIGKFPLGGVAIIHKEFTPCGHFLVWTLKALSKLLCLTTIAKTAFCVILVKKSLATSAFSTGFRGKVLTNIALHQAVGLNDAHAIAKSILLGELPNAAERKASMVQKIMANVTPEM